MKQRNMNWLVAVSVLGALLSACGGSVGGDDDDTTSNAELASAITIIGEAVKSDVNATRAESRTACSGVAFGACSASAKTRNFSTSGGDSDGCTRGSGGVQLSVFGTATLAFSRAACAYTTAGDTITRTLANHYVTDVGARKVLLYTGAGTVGGKTIAASDLVDFDGIERSGGHLLTYVDATHSTLTVNGIHRRGVSAAGRYTFWHTLYTTTPLTVLIGAGTYTIASGSLYLKHNRASITVKMDFSSVIFDTTCNYPTAGTITYTLTGPAGNSTSFTVDFTATCGTATVSGTSTALAGN